MILKFFYEEANNQILQIDQPYLETDILDPIKARAYHILQTDVAQMFGIHHTNASFYMREVFNFEKEIAAVIKNSEN